MAIGTGIFLIVLGAILTFAVNASVEAINLGVVGWICMGAGAFAIILSLAMGQMSRSTTHREIREENVDAHEHSHHTVS